MGVEVAEVGGREVSVVVVSQRHKPTLCCQGGRGKRGSLKKRGERMCFGQ